MFSYPETKRKLGVSAAADQAIRCNLFLRRPTKKDFRCYPSRKMHITIFNEYNVKALTTL